MDSLKAITLKRGIAAEVAANICPYTKDIFYKGIFFEATVGNSVSFRYLQTH